MQTDYLINDQPVRPFRRAFLKRRLDILKGLRGKVEKHTVPKSRRVKEKSSLHPEVFPVSRPSRITHNAVTSVFKGGEKQDSFHTSVKLNETLATSGKSTSPNGRP